MYEYSFQEKRADGSWSTLMQYDSLEEIQASLPEYCREFCDDYGFWPVYGRHYKVSHDVPSHHVLMGVDLPQDSDREARAW